MKLLRISLIVLVVLSSMLISITVCASNLTSETVVETNESLNEENISSENGFFYFDRSDKKDSSREKIGIGKRLNFGHPISWVIAIVTFGIIIFLYINKKRRRKNEDNKNN